MRHDSYNQICHLRRHYGVYRPIYWHNELEHGCHEHMKYMLFHKICQHAPQSMLNGAFECVGHMTFHEQISEKEAVDRLLFDNIAQSIDHLKLILEAKYIAMSYGCINGDRYNHYICIRGYL